MAEHVPALGRRARSMRDKRQRIVAAATALFASHGFAGTTTQQIAETADVAAGTLFRYAATKGELFLMVYNEALARAVSSGWDEADEKARHGGDVTECVAAAAAALYRETSGAMDAHVYQRELLFGDPHEPNRATGLGIVLEFEAGIAQRLLASLAPTSHPEPEAADPAVARLAARTARTIFAIVNLELVRRHTETGRAGEKDPETELRAQVVAVVRGFQAMASSAVGNPPDHAHDLAETSARPARTHRTND